MVKGLYFNLNINLVILKYFKNLNQIKTCTCFNAQKRNFNICLIYYLHKYVLLNCEQLSLHSKYVLLERKKTINMYL